jgi:hypothetical protein
MKRRREKEKLFRCDHTLKQKKQCIWDYFSRIFVVLSSSTNFFLEVSLSFVSECRQQNRVGYLSEKRKKNQEKTFQLSNILYKKKHFYLLNNVYHGHKHKINNSIFEHKAPFRAECYNGPKLPSSLARWKYR